MVGLVMNTDVDLYEKKVENKRRRKREREESSLERAEHK